MKENHRMTDYYAKFAQWEVDKIRTRWKQTNQTSNPNRKVDDNLFVFLTNEMRNENIQNTTLQNLKKVFSSNFLKTCVVGSCHVISQNFIV